MPPENRKANMQNVQDFVQFLSIKRGLDDNSIKQILSRYNLIKTHLENIKKPLNPQTVEEYIFSLKFRKLKPNSINAYIFMLRHLLAYYKDRKIETEDFTSGLKTLRHPPPPIEVLSEQEVEELINNIVPYGRFRTNSAEEVTRSLNDIYRVFTRFLSRTGARFSEAMNLKCRHVDLWEGRATFVDTKNDDYRHVWFTEPLISEIAKSIEGKGPDDKVFTNFLGSPIIPVNYGFHLKKSTKMLNITKKVHPHIFRHTFATALYAATKDIGLVQIVLGHRDIKSTMIYIHLADDSIKKGLYRHPFNRNSIKSEDFIKMVIESVQGYKMHEYRQFNPAKIQEAIGIFNGALYDAVLPSFCAPKNLKYYTEK